MSKSPLLQLLVTLDDASTQTYTYDGPRVSLGRDASNLLSLDATFLSRQHAEFRLADGRWFYEDSGSVNGTKVHSDAEVQQVGGPNGLKTTTLKGGEALIIGRNLRIDIRILERGAGREDHVLEEAILPSEALRGLSDGGELGLLFETVRAVSRCSTDQEVLQVISDAAMSAMPSLTHLLFVERGAAGWEARWSCERPGAQRGGSAPELSQTLLDRAAERGESQLFSTLAPSAVSSQSMVTAKISSSVCVPLMGLDGQIGVVQADCRGNTATLRLRELHLMTLLAEQAGVILDRLRITRSIQQMFEGVVNASVKAIESRDPSTAGHSERVAHLSLHLASIIDGRDHGPFAHVRFAESDLRTLRYSALLHDFGKIAVPTELLLKPRKLLAHSIQEIRGRFALARMEVRARAAERKVEALIQSPMDATGSLHAIDAEAHQQLRWLDNELHWLVDQMEPGELSEPHAERLRALTREWHSAGVRLLEPSEVQAMISCGRGTLTVEERLRVQEHASWTRCYLEEIPWSKDLLRVPDFAGDHHEKLNGRGYPRGVEAKGIPLQVRILTVCDIYDALTDRDRPYRTAMPAERALGILHEDVDRGALDGNVVSVLEDVLRAADVI